MRTILNADTQVREFGITFQLELLFLPTFSKKVLIGNFIFIMYPVVSATIACYIHRTHGGDDTFQPIHYPSPRSDYERNSLMTCMP